MKGNDRLTSSGRSKDICYWYLRVHGHVELLYRVMYNHLTFWVEEGFTITAVAQRHAH